VTTAVGRKGSEKMIDESGNRFEPSNDKGCAKTQKRTALCVCHCHTHTHTHGVPQKVKQKILGLDLVLNDFFSIHFERLCDDW